MDPLQTFKQLYGEVPAWVATMHEYAPDALQAYTDLRMTVMKDGALSRKHKELLLVGVNAARRYETSMLYHTQGALDAGATIEEIADTVLTGVVSRGLPAWLEGQKAIKYALDRMNPSAEQANQGTEMSLTQFPDVPSCQAYYLDEFGAIPEWAAMMREYNPDAFVAYTNLRNSTLCNRETSAWFKELLLVAINASERYDLGVEIHVKGALAKGATKEQLSECLLTCVLTAGIPAWFMGWAHLRD